MKNQDKNPEIPEMQELEGYFGINIAVHSFRLNTILLGDNNT